MKRLIISNILLAMLILVTRSDAQQIHSINQQIKLAENGSADVHLIVSFSGNDSLGSFQVPFGFNEVTGLEAYLDHPGQAVDVQLVMDRTSPVLKFHLNPGSEPHKLYVNSKVEHFLDWEAAGPQEFKTYSWKVVYTNTLPTRIDSCSLNVLLPSGWNYHRILSSEPEFKRKDPEPPFTLFLVNGRANVSISRKSMEYLDRITLEFAFKNEQKPTILITVGVLLIALYLYYFRNLILKKAKVETIISNNNNKENN